MPKFSKTLAYQKSFLEIGENQEGERTIYITEVGKDEDVRTDFIGKLLEMFGQEESINISIKVENKVD